MTWIEEAILKLWNEGQTAKTIAQKLGIDLDVVEDIISAPGNYLNHEALKALCDY